MNETGMNKNFPCNWDGSNPIIKYRTCNTPVPSWTWRTLVAKALHTANVCRWAAQTCAYSQAHLPGKRHVNFYYKTVHPDSIQGHLLHTATFKILYQHFSNPIRTPPAGRFSPHCSYTLSQRIRVGWVGHLGPRAVFVLSANIYFTPVQLSVSSLVSTRWHRLLAGLQTGNGTADHEGDFCFSGLHWLLSRASSLFFCPRGMHDKFYACINRVSSLYYHRTQKHK